MVRIGHSIIYFYMVQNGHNVYTSIWYELVIVYSISIWYEMVIMYLLPVPYGTKWSYSVILFPKWLLSNITYGWYEMVMVQIALCYRFSCYYRFSDIHLHLHSTTIHQNSDDYTSALRKQTLKKNIYIIIINKN
jgi:hypothetical protein